MELNTFFIIYEEIQIWAYFYSNNANHELVGYADAGFLSDSHKGWSQTGYLFTCGNTVISWRSTK
jgi:hypothetical protein